MGTRDVTEPQGDTPAGDNREGRVGLVGRTLGRYRISAELGRGGMATVYRAFDPQLARDVAIKVIHGAFTGRGDIEKRFRREAQAVAALKHDCIVDVFDFAPGGDGEPAYIVSELVEGPTLRQLLERAGGRLPPEIAVLVATRVASALAAAHARGIVHRDVKPDNVMIDFGKGGARVLLTDFGIARMVEDDTMTATGSILGSPSYMSPEQARSGTIEPASDVFSLGVTLYQMVVGRTPFQGKDPLTVIAALISGEYLRPGRVEARVGPELEALIVRCLKHQAAERYADGNQLVSALRELAATAPATVVADEAATLRSFRDDPKALERRLAAPVADSCVERARAAIRRGELTKALAQINRAVAYAPGHRGAESLLAAISSRRRWTKVIAASAALALVGGAAVGARSLLRREPPREATHLVLPSAVPPSTATPPAPAALSAAPATATAGAAPPEERSVPAPREERAAAPARKRERGKHLVAPPPAAAAAPVASPPAATPSPPPPPPAVEAPPPAPRAAPAPTAGITLRARQGFCSPSLDDRAPALRPIYQGVSVGRHQVYCTLPDGSRALAGSYELRAGTHPDLIIVPGPDGRPTLGRPE
jgi:serine/threonine-protein kinase